MKNIIKVAILAVALCTSMSVSAQKFAKINTQEIIAAMAETKEAQTNLEAFAKDLGEQLEAIQVEFNNKYADYQKVQATLAESVKQMKQQELQQLQQRYEEFQRISQEDYNKKAAELMEPIQKKAKEAIEAAAKKLGVTAVFDTAIPSTIYLDATVADLTATIKTALNIKEEAPATK